MESVCVFLLWALVLLVVPPVSSSEGPENISTHVGEDIRLPCKAPTGVNLEDVVEWTRPDLGPDQYVFCYRDGRPDPDTQHPSYQDRVDLAHSQLKDGDLSVVLKNVTTNDSGTFKCYLKQPIKRRKRSRSDSGPIRTIILKVSDPGSSESMKETGDEGGPEDRRRPGLILGSVVPFVVVLSVVLWAFFRPKKQNSENPAAN